MKTTTVILDANREALRVQGLANAKPRGVKQTRKASGQNVREKDVSAPRLEIGRHGANVQHLENVQHSEIAHPDATGLPLATGHRVRKAEAFLIALHEATARHAQEAIVHHEHSEIGRHGVTDRHSAIVQRSKIGHRERNDRHSATVHLVRKVAGFLTALHEATVHRGVIVQHSVTVRLERKDRLLEIVNSDLTVHHEGIVRHAQVVIVHLGVIARHSEIGHHGVKDPRSVIVLQEMIVRPELTVRHGERAQEEAFPIAHRAVTVHRVRKDEAFRIVRLGVTAQHSEIGHHAGDRPPRRDRPQSGAKGAPWQWPRLERPATSSQILITHSPGPYRYSAHRFWNTGAGL